MADRAKPAHSGPQLMTLHYHEKGDGLPLLLLHGNRPSERVTDMYPIDHANSSA